jgi:hypothetical protein
MEEYTISCNSLCVVWSIPNKTVPGFARPYRYVLSVHFFLDFCFDMRVQCGSCCVWICDWETVSYPVRLTGQSSMDRRNKQQTEDFNPSNLPFETNYNDHFETPLQAYLDVKPLLDWFLMHCDNVDKNNSNMIEESCNHQSVQTGSKSEISCPKLASSYAPQLGSSQTKLTLYDPYYCNGRTSFFLKQLGCGKVVHEARDFYVDISRNEIPQYDVLITNPPYSDTHKIKCLDYCFQKLRGIQETSTRDKGKLFLLLMPAYTATKQYYRDCLGDPLVSISDAVYLIPSVPYKYDHPDKTGKDESPFESLWFCLIGKHRVKSFQQYWQSLPTQENLPKLATSLTQLQANEVISLTNRPNPRHRRRLRRNKEDKSRNKNKGSIENCTDDAGRKHDAVATDDVTIIKNSINLKKSKYRDPVSGARKKNRF